jgi:hypothetical protein
MNLAVLPLAVTMMAGPQILAALIFATNSRAVAVSAAFVAGVAIAATTGVAIMRWLAGAVGLGGQSTAGGVTARVVKAGLVVLLLLGLAVKNWRNRANSEPPEWLGRLLSAGAGQGLLTGLLLIGLFPSDVLVMLTVGIDLAQHDAPLTEVLPFIAATVLIAAAPLLCYLLFRRRAQELMPKVRDWMKEFSWLVNIIVCLFFVLLILL